MNTYRPTNFTLPEFTYKDVWSDLHPEEVLTRGSFNLIGVIPQQRYFDRDLVQAYQQKLPIMLDEWEITMPYLIYHARATFKVYYELTGKIAV